MEKEDKYVYDSDEITEEMGPFFKDNDTETIATKS